MLHDSVYFTTLKSLDYNDVMMFRFNNNNNNYYYYKNKSHIKQLKALKCRAQNGRKWLFMQWLCRVSTDLLLLTNNLWELCVDYSWVEFTAHQQGTLIVFDVAEICRLCQLNCWWETLTSRQSIHEHYKLSALIQHHQQIMRQIQVWDTTVQ